MRKNRRRLRHRHHLSSLAGGAPLSPAPAADGRMRRSHSRLMPRCSRGYLQLYSADEHRCSHRAQLFESTRGTRMLRYAETLMPSKKCSGPKGRSSELSPWGCGCVCRLTVVSKSEPANPATFSALVRLLPGQRERNHVCGGGTASSLAHRASNHTFHAANSHRSSCGPCGRRRLAPLEKCR